MFKYFAGVKDQYSLKAKFRELAKINHPDRGGNTATFQEIRREYEYIINSNTTFPISSDQTSYNGADDFRDIANKYAYAQKKAEQANNAIWEEIRKRTAGNPVFDDNCKVIDHLIKLCVDEGYSARWFLCEMFKLTDLGLRHFQYARIALKKNTVQGKQLSDEWVTTAYKNYVAVQSTNWNVS